MITITRRENLGCTPDKEIRPAFKTASFASLLSSEGLGIDKQCDMGFPSNKSCCANGEYVLNPGANVDGQTAS